MRRPPALLPLLLLALALPGCALIDANQTKLRPTSEPSNPADKRSPRDHFVEALGKAKDTSRGPFALALAPIELWAPFSIELSIGIFDLDARVATLGSTACLELHDEAALGEPFASMCADFLQGLTQTRASVSDSLVEEHFAVFQVELQLEADAETLFFRSRERGADEWIEIATLPFSQEAALLAGLSVQDLTKKGRLGFDDLLVTRGGVRPEPLSATDSFVVALEDALLQLQAGCAALDGADRDAGAATIALEAALVALAEATLAAPLLPDTKETRKAAKRVTKAEKKTRGALAKLGKGKEDPAVKSIQKAMRSAADAILLAEPRVL